MSKADCDDNADGGDGSSNDNGSADLDNILKIVVLMGKVAMMLQVTLLNVMEVPKWK